MSFPEPGWFWPDRLTPAMKRAMRRLMLADNLGDVHEGLDALRGAVGLLPLEGNFLDGWTDADWAALEAEK